MRKQFVKTVSNIFLKDKRCVILLGDIGVYGFKNLFKTDKKRIYNIGILEQSMISLSAGLAKAGLKPIVHTIAPFIVSRAFEQLKIDIGYNKLGAKFVSIGSSYDYAALGCTHHCPEDINLMYNIPNMQIVVPGNSYEFDLLFKQTYQNNKPSYCRLSDYENKDSFKVKFGKANFVNKKSRTTILAVGPVLNFIYPIIEMMNINLIYLTTIRPFDKNIIQNLKSRKIKNLIIVEPFYSGAILSEIVSKHNLENLRVKVFSVPFKFLSNYGSKFQHDKKIGLTSKNLINFIKKISKNNS